MFSWVANLALRSPRRVAAVSGAFFILAGVVGGPTAGMLNARNSFEAPSSQSSLQMRTIERATGEEPTPGVLVLVAAPPSSPVVASTARAVAGVSGVARVVTPPATRGGAASGLVSRSGRESLIAVTLYSAPDPDKIVKAIQARLHGRPGVLLGGGDVAGEQISSLATKDLGFAELLAFPLLALLTWLIFRGVAALLPVAVGGISVLGAFVVLRLVNAELSLSSFALNLVIGLGLGLAVDYSLLLVWRFREELGRGETVPGAITTTLATAGRTVVFSAITVAAAMMTLTLFPQRFLQSMGIGGATVALVAAVASLLIVPSLLVLLASRIGRVTPRPEGTGHWYRVAQSVMRRPVLVALLTTVGLLVVASPTLGVRWSGIDAAVLPSSQSARVVSDMLTSEFPSQELYPIVIAAVAPPTAGPELRRYVQQLRAVRGVTSVRAPQYVGMNTWSLTLGATGDPISPAAQRTVEQVRDVRAPVAVQVGGAAAQFRDQKIAIAGSLPLALSVLAIVTLLILWLMTGSVVLPLKAFVMNALTAATATGMLVFIFQDGRLTGPLAYSSQGGIEQTDFLVLAALVFALSTDYGVLLMTRIKEARDKGLANREAIAVGLEHTGRVVSASAILLSVAIGAFATSQVVFLKEIGVGTLVAVIVDAFIVRTALVPALMALLGERNWWSPAPLRRLHDRIGLAEGVGAKPTGAAAEAGQRPDVATVRT